MQYKGKYFFINYLLQKRTAKVTNVRIYTADHEVKDFFDIMPSVCLATHTGTRQPFIS
jgi:hypothetical protein